MANKVGRPRKLLECPECLAAGVPQLEWRDARHLGTHRRFVHNVQGVTSKYYVPVKLRKGNNDAKGIPQSRTEPDTANAIERTTLGDIQPQDLAYIFGRVEAQVQAYAVSNNIPANELASRVAVLLQRASRR